MVTFQSLKIFILTIGERNNCRSRYTRKSITPEAKQKKPAFLIDEMYFILLSERKKKKTHLYDL